MVEKKKINFPVNDMDRTFRNSDVILEKLRDFCKNHSGWSGIAFAFIFGLIVNALSDPGLHSFMEVIRRIFSLTDRPINILSWLAVGTILFLSLGRYVLGLYLRTRAFEVRMANLFREKVSESATLFQKGRIAWGPSVTLQISPNLREGWLVGKVCLEYISTMYVLPKDIEPVYRNFKKDAFDKRYKDDRTRLMIIENPVAYTDAPTLRLKLQETKWSYTQFYKEWVWPDPSKRNKIIQEILDGSINVPNSLALLLVVSTSDGYVLLTQTSSKAANFPNAWTCSIGEHVDLADFTGPEENYALNWLNRALWEELGISTDGYGKENARIMAVILETEIVNCGLVGVVTLNIDRVELDAMIDKKIRSDYEFQNWEFIQWNKLANELMNPSKIYHPSTGLRMLYAGIYKYGASDFSRQLLSKKK